MPSNLNENELLLRCACGSSNHIMILVYEPDDSRGNNLKAEGDFWYLSVQLDHFAFWKRLRMAFRYAFAPDTIQFGTTAELVLHNGDVDHLCEFIVAKRRLAEAK